MNLGTLPVDTFKLGALQVDKIYLGSLVAWQALVEGGSFVYDVANMADFDTHDGTKTESGAVISLGTGTQTATVGTPIDSGGAIYKGLQSSTTGGEPFTASYEFTDISVNSTTDVLNTTTEIVDGDKLVIVLDDDSVNEVAASGVTESDNNTVEDVYRDGSDINYYPLEVDSTALSGDTSTDTAIAYTDGWAVFNGSSSKIITTSTVGTAFTVGFIVNSATIADNSTLLAIRNTTSPSQLRYTASNGLWLSVNDGGSGSYNTNININDGVDHEIIWSVGGLSHILWVDGVKHTYTASGNLAGTRECVLGIRDQSEAAASNYFSGKLKSFRVINRQLVDGEEKIFLDDYYSMPYTGMTATSKAFAVGALPSFNFGGNGFIQAVDDGSGSYVYVDPKLTSTRTFNQLIAPVGGMTLQTQTMFKSEGDKMTDLRATILKEDS
ncbi:MAG: hypothetical protein DRG27_03895 [Deltaproteobacteria bacterium]|nr:MAG: hypothetical protein DRG27_03895 [Deltaproteobacteria bacterium]